MNLKFLFIIIKIFIYNLIFLNQCSNLNEYSSPILTSVSTSSLQSTDTNDYDENENNFDLRNFKQNSNYSKQIQTNYLKCKTDSNCIDTNSICLNGNCVKICTNSNELQLKSSQNKDCIYFHCDSKKLILSTDLNKQQEQEANIFNNNDLLENYYDNFSIETNNYPLLDRYLRKKKCSWLLKNLNHFNQSENETLTSQQENSFIQLKFERFSTKLANDYLYIFAGDSIYSPLIAALSGNQVSSNNPSNEIIDENEIFDETEQNNDILNFNTNEQTSNAVNVTFFNLSSLYLLFKSDLLSHYSSLSSFKTSFSSDENKPNGISIKYKFSSPCNDNLNTKNPNNICFNDFKTGYKKITCPDNSLDCHLKSNFVETINYKNDFAENQILNSSLRRALHCSFKHKNFLYLIGGYSYTNSISFVSRLNLENLKWEHSLDRKASSIINRKNRRLFSNNEFQQPKLDLPQNRYAHSCALDTENGLLYMYGGIIYENDNSLQSPIKQTTNELWLFNLETNKWTLLNEAEANIKTYKNYVLPIAVSGHSMHLFKKNENISSIFIFFGYSEYYGSTLYIIQEYNLESKTWNLHNTYNINIGYGHSSIYDPRTFTVYFYGGLVSGSDIAKSIYSPFDLSEHLNKHFNNRYLQSPLLSSNLYSFNLYYFEWTKLAKTSESCYMHSSALYGDKLIFYGGICIDDDQKLPQDQIFTSNKFRMYDLDQNEWLMKFNLKNRFNYESSLKLNKRHRYGHTSFLNEDSLHIFGGFNGFFLKDLFKINLSLIINETSQNSFMRFKRDFLKQDDLNNNDYFIKDQQKNMHESRFLTQIELCNRYTSCSSCQLDSNCVWNNKQCEYYTPIDLNSLNVSLNRNQTYNFKQIYKKPSCSQMCSEHTSCLNCTLLTNINGIYQNECVWCASQLKCVHKKALQIYYPFGECFNLINDRQQCERSSSQTSSQQAEPLFTSNTNVNTCSVLHSNCSSCIRDERCGWCSKDEAGYGSFNTGYGTCIEGGESSSLNDKCKLNWFFSKCPLCECNGHSTCSNSSQKTCDRCLNNTDGEYCSECKKGFYGNPKNNGICLACDCGQQASECDTTNGRCYCNTKGVVGTRCDQCDSPRYTGRPNMTDGSCFYNLTTDYQFTFNLNKESDRFYSKINFVNHPIRTNDDDIDFMVRCYRETAMINITYVANYDQYDNELNGLLNDDSLPTLSTFNGVKWPFDFLDNLTLFLNNLNDNRNTSTDTKLKVLTSRQNQFIETGYNYYFGPIKNQQILLEKINCTSSEFKYTFSNRDLNYADKSRNLVFIVYVYDFQTPITIQIAFSRKSKIQLLHFFITFFGCLLTLLTIAFVTWKSKQRFDRYRRQRQIVIQMEHMASRPFTRLLVDVTNRNDKEIKIIEGVEKGDAGEIKMKKSPKKAKKNENKKLKFHLNNDASDIDKKNIEKIDDESSKFKIMPMAVEPLNNQKTAIVTCLIKLPQGGLNTIPKGSSPFILGSTYVLLNSSSPLLSNIVTEPLDEDDDEKENDKNNQQNKQV